MTYSAVASSLQSARTRDELVKAAQCVQFVKSITDRERLAQIVKRRLSEFKQH